MDTQTVTVRLYGGLKDLVAWHRDGCVPEHPLSAKTSVKDLLEGLGVPHTEVDLILVNGQCVAFSHLVQAGDRVAAYPPFFSLPVPSEMRLTPPIHHPVKFVADVHLGRLATLLRLFGFDVLWGNDADDEQLAQVAVAGRRILLTRDRGLLKRACVTHGLLVRSDWVEEQLAQVVGRYDLALLAAPFSRCPRCNTPLVEADPAQVRSMAPPRVQETVSSYRSCPSCGRLFWRGTHVARIERLFERVVSRAAQTPQLADSSFRAPKTRSHPVR